MKTRSRLNEHIMNKGRKYNIAEYYYISTYMSSYISTYMSSYISTNVDVSPMS